MIEKSESWNAASSVAGPAAHPVLEPLEEVSNRNGHSALAMRLMELRQWLADDLAVLDASIDSFADPERGAKTTDGKPHLGWRAAAHLLSRPGKRLRPMCVLLAARLGGLGLVPAVRDLAVASELVHAATLLHDDVIDEGTERRGAPCSRVVYGNSASILAGDQLFVEALRLVEQAGQPDLLRGLLSVISEMIAAEALQLERRGHFDPNRQRYLEVLHGKTAALFRWGLSAGGTIAGLAEEDIATLGRLGTALGIAFQLVDDLLDLDGDPQLTGKDALADLRQGKLTWPFIVGAECDEELRAELEQLVNDESAAERTDFQELLDRLQATGAFEVTRRFACEQGEKARQELARLPQGPTLQALATVVEAAIHRAR